MAPVPLRLRRSAPPGRGRRCSDSIRRSGPEGPRLSRETIQGQPPRDTRWSTRARRRCYCFRRLGLGSPDGAGTHPALPGGTSARPSICVRSSSRKRAQSARRSSETNSPGGSDSGTEALSGCCLGSRNHSPLPVETVGNSRVQTAGAARSGLSSGDVAARLYSVAPGPANPPNVRADQTSGGARSNSAVTMIR